MSGLIKKAEHLLSRLNRPSNLDWWLFLVVAFIPIYFVWVFPFFPAQDGFVHLYTVRLLDWYWTSPATFPSMFESQIDLQPNWFCQLFLYVGMKIFNLDLSYRLLLSLYFIALPLALLWNLQALGKVFILKSWLFLPFILNHLLIFGFYNYLFGIIFFLFITGYLLRIPDHPFLWNWLLLSVAGVVTYFFHSIVALLFILAVMLRFRKVIWKEKWNLVISFSPLMALVGYFVFSANPSPRVWQEIPVIFSQIILLPVLSPFSSTASFLILFWVVLMLTAIVLDFRFGVKMDAIIIFFYLLAAIAFIFCFAMPDRSNGGSIIQYRLTILPWIFLLLALRFTSKKLILVLVFFSVLIYAHQLVKFWQVAESAQIEYSAFQKIMAKIPANSVVLNFNTNSKGERSDGTSVGVRSEIFLHAHLSVALEKNLPVPLNYYQGESLVFPFRFRDQYEFNYKRPNDLIQWEERYISKVDYLVIQKRVGDITNHGWENYFEPIETIIAISEIKLLKRKPQTLYP